MKKILYVVLLVIGIIGTLAILFFPVAKFDNEKILNNTTEYYAIKVFGNSLTATRDSAAYRSLSKEEKEEYKKLFKNINGICYAVVNTDYDLLYEYTSYTIIDNIYIDVVGKSSGLTADSSKAEIEQTVKFLKDLMGDESFDIKKQETLEKRLIEIKEPLFEEIKEDAISNGYDNVDEYIIRVSEIMVEEDLFNIFYGLDGEITVETIEKIHNKGFYYKDFLKGLNNIFKTDHLIYETTDSSDLTFIKKIKLVINSSNFINPVPLLVLFLVYTLLLICFIIFIVNGIKGLSGKHYPHSFKTSIWFGIISLLILYIVELIPRTYAFEYHYTEYSRLMNYLQFTNASIIIVICPVFCIVTVLISLLGRFCKWGKREKED